MTDVTTIIVYHAASWVVKNYEKTISQKLNQLEWWYRHYSDRNTQFYIHVPYIRLLIERELLSIEVLHCGNRNFRPFWLLWPWPWPDYLQVRTWPVLHGYMPHVQVWTSYVKAFESYRMTDVTTKIIYHAASWVVKTMKRPYLRNYTSWSDGIDITVTAIPNFIFVCHTYGSW